MPPSYTVVVCKIEKPLTPMKYICSIAADRSARFAWGVFVGLGRTARGAVDDWEERVDEWLKENRGFTSWPRPIPLDPRRASEEIVHTFTWPANILKDNPLSSN